MMALAGCTTSNGRGHQEDSSIVGDKEEMMRVPSDDSSPDKIYLVMTSSGGVQTCRDLVVRNLKAALSFSQGGDQTFVFLVRPTSDSKSGLVSGFSFEQLVALMRMSDIEARAKVAEHDWVLSEKPDIEKNWVSPLL